MMVLSIALAWLAVGIVAAVIFGTAAGRANRGDEDEAMPQQMSAEVKYMRRTRRGRCQLAQTALTEFADDTTLVADSQKKTSCQTPHDRVVTNNRQRAS